MTKNITKEATIAAMKNYRMLAALILGTLLLSACETTGPIQTDPVATPQEQTTPSVEVIQPIPSLPASEYAEQFTTADQHLLKFDWMSAQLALSPIRLASISDSDSHYIRYMDARISYIRGDVVDAKKATQSLLQQPLQPALERRVLYFQRYIDGLAGRYLESARAGDRLLKATPPGLEADALRREIWRDLQRLTPAQNETEEDAGLDSQWMAWLELSRICATPSSPAQRRQALTLWRENNFRHPAAKVLPGGLDYLLNTTPQANRVTLLLPLSGKLATAAQAIRDGFLASYYASRELGGQHFDVEVVDILAYESATAAYQNAVAGGATMIVGPLGKFAVKEIGKLSNRSVPVLALNRTDTSLFTSTTAMVQLALSPEDEAKQIAKVAYGQGVRNALVLRPANHWGKKMYSAFASEWNSLGGTIASEGAYNGQQDYSQSVSDSLGLAASEQRAGRVKNLLGSDIEFSPRRRQDIDAVFLLARNPAQARAVKPLLAYHYAASVPVYATSSIYRGLPDIRDKDLNGITVLEIPWLLETDPATAQLRSDFNEDRYARLHALGADAFLVQSRFAQLQAGQDALIRGNTGLLSLSPELQLHRELPTATFDGGLLVAE